MSSWEECRAVERDPAKVSGAWVFANTRVPVRALFGNLEDGATVDQFVEWFPGVTREQVEAVLEFAAASLELQASASRFSSTKERRFRCDGFSTATKSTRCSRRVGIASPTATSSPSPVTIATPDSST